MEIYKFMSCLLIRNNTKILSKMSRRKIASLSVLDNSKKIKTNDPIDHNNLVIESASNVSVSGYFLNTQESSSSTTMNIAEQVLQAQLELNRVLAGINFKVSPIQYVYNPLEYAFSPNKNYVEKYCTSTKKFLFVGMNPGPFGMCQTGVPFGDPKWVREWLKIEGVVTKPNTECPSRQITGLDSIKKEVSGDRLWSFFSQLSGEPNVFFKHSFVCNYCPLAFMNDRGVNVTPSDIKNLQVRKFLETACDEWYLKLINILQPEIVIAVGTYIDKKTKDLFKAKLIENIKVLCLPHPSPRAKNNQNWHEKADNFLTTHNLKSYFQQN